MVIFHWIGPILQIHLYLIPSFALPEFAAWMGKKFKCHKTSLFFGEMLKIAYSPIYVLPLPAKHRFPMEKYELIPEQLLYEGTATEDNFFAPMMISREALEITHTPEYVEDRKSTRLNSSHVAISYAVFC